MEGCTSTMGDCTKMSDSKRRALGKTNKENICTFLPIEGTTSVFVRLIKRIFVHKMSGNKGRRTRQEFRDELESPAKLERNSTAAHLIYAISQPLWHSLFWLLTGFLIRLGSAVIS